MKTFVCALFVLCVTSAVAVHPLRYSFHSLDPALVEEGTHAQDDTDLAVDLGTRFRVDEAAEAKVRARRAVAFKDTRRVGCESEHQGFALRPCYFGSAAKFKAASASATKYDPYLAFCRIGKAGDGGLSKVNTSNVESIVDTYALSKWTPETILVGYQADSAKDFQTYKATPVTACSKKSDKVAEITVAGAKEEVSFDGNDAEAFCAQFTTVTAFGKKVPYSAGYGHYVMQSSTDSKSEGLPLIGMTVDHAFAWKSDKSTGLELGGDKYDKHKGAILEIVTSPFETKEKFLTAMSFINKYALISGACSGDESYRHDTLHGRIKRTCEAESTSAEFCPDKPGTDHGHYQQLGKKFHAGAKHGLTYVLTKGDKTRATKCTVVHQINFGMYLEASMSKEFQEQFSSMPKTVKRCQKTITKLANSLPCTSQGYLFWVLFGGYVQSTSGYAEAQNKKNEWDIMNKCELGKAHVEMAKSLWTFLPDEQAAITTFFTDQQEAMKSSLEAAGSSIADQVVTNAVKVYEGTEFGTGTGRPTGPEKMDNGKLLIVVEARLGKAQLNKDSKSNPGKVWDTIAAINDATCPDPNIVSTTTCKLCCRASVSTCKLYPSRDRHADQCGAFTKDEDCDAKCKYYQKPGTPKVDCIKK